MTTKNNSQFVDCFAGIRHHLGQAAQECLDANGSLMSSDPSITAMYKAIHAVIADWEEARNLPFVREALRRDHAEQGAA